MYDNPYFSLGTSKQGGLMFCQPETLISCDVEGQGDLASRLETLKFRLVILVIPIFFPTYFVHMTRNPKP